MKKTLRFILSSGLCCFALAHDQILQKNTSNLPDYAERLARTKAHAPEKMSVALQGNTIYKLRKEEMLARGMSSEAVAEALYGGGPAFAFPYRARPDLRSKGSVKTLTILIDFKDLPATALFHDLNTGSIHENIYGPGTKFAQTQYPYDSVNAYYKRASQTQVDIDGNVLGWYHFPKNRESYRPNITGLANSGKFAKENAAIFAMTKEALLSLGVNHDFNQYDNDQDGYIDLVTILYAGPPTGWGSFWWAYQWSFFTPEAANVTFGGKRVKQFIFEFVSLQDGGREFDPRTLTHEMGHAFGLPDYYDYDEEVGPPGGVGRLDMMDANWANHNAFSRWLLEWIQPDIIASGAPRKCTLNASGSSLTNHKVVAIFPHVAESDAPAQELFLIENRMRIGNDGGIANIPGEGLLIWHVVATPNSTDDAFLLDNSFTSTKLIRLMRSGTAKDFSKSADGDDQASELTFFKKGRTFTPISIPDTKDYVGHETGISVTDISDPGEKMTANIGFLPTGRSFEQPDSRIQIRSIPRRGDVVSAATAQPLDLNRLEEAATKAAEASPQELRKVWAEIATVAKLSQLTRQQRIVLEMQLQQWASKDGTVAVAALLNSDAKGFVNRVMPPILDAWSMSDAQAARAWFESAANKNLLAQREIKLGGQFVRSIFTWHAKNDFDSALVAALKPENAEIVVDAIQGIEAAADVAGIDRDTIYVASAKAGLPAGSKSAIEGMLFDRAAAALRVDPHAASKTILSYEKFRTLTRP